MKLKACFCENVAIGSYAHQVLMKCPMKESHGGMVAIDVCIATEIAELWHQGVYTMASCCGHGKYPASVSTHPNDERQMIELGYKRDPSRTSLWLLRTGTKVVKNLAPGSSPARWWWPVDEREPNPVRDTILDQTHVRWRRLHSGHWVAASINITFHSWATLLMVRGPLREDYDE